MTEIETPEKPVVAAILSDLECSTITVVVTLADDAQVTVPMKLIPQYRMMQLNAMIPAAPLPAPTDAVKKADGTIDWKINYNDPTYIAASNEVWFKRNCLNLAEMVLLPIPGDTLEDRAQYIREKFDPLVTDQLVSVVGMQREKVKARILTRAETFHN